jgi:predicted permease
VRTRLRHGIVIPQVALSLVLLLVAAVHVRALLAIERADPGYRTEGSIVFTIGRWEPREPFGARAGRTREEAQQAQEKEAATIRAFNRAVLERVGSLPQVDAYAIAAGLPVSSGYASLESVITQDAYNAGEAPRGSAMKTVVSDGYFDAMGMRLLRGRTFDARDAPYEQFGRHAAVISESVARALWPAGDALGQSLSFLSDSPGQQIHWLEVIGIVNDVRPVLHEDVARPRVYVSLGQQWRGSARSLVVRGRGDQAALIRDVKAAVVGADAFAEVSRVQTMEQVVGEILYPRRIAAAVLTAAGLIGLLLASIGLYGVMAYSTAQRMREIGIRATLGAERRDIIGLVLREGAIIMAAATAAGFAIALLALRATSNLLPDLPAVDVLSFIAVPAALAAIIGTACVIPARRAASVDPAQVLRM